MGKKRQSRGLGKGLGALIPTTAEEAATSQTGSGLRLVPVKAIQANPMQPRTQFSPEALQELADSIGQHGLIQPLIVSQEEDDKYTLIAGERRWRASQLAGLEQVPVVVKNDVTAAEMLELALIENIQREDLNPLEEGLAYRQLMDDFGMTHAEVARRVGKARSTVSNTVRLLDLAPAVQQAIIDGLLSGGHARALHPLNAEEQIAVMGSIVRSGLSVRQTEEIVRKMQEKVVPPKKQQNSLPPEVADLQHQFRTRLGTRVEIEHGRKGGRVVIHYYSDEELNAIYDTILGDDAAA